MLAINVRLSYAFAIVAVVGAAFAWTAADRTLPAPWTRPHAVHPAPPPPLPAGHQGSGRFSLLAPPPCRDGAIWVNFHPAEDFDQVMRVLMPCAFFDRLALGAPYRVSLSDSFVGPFANLGWRVLGLDAREQ